MNACRGILFPIEWYTDTVIKCIIAQCIYE